VEPPLVPVNAVAGGKLAGASRADLGIRRLGGTRVRQDAVEKCVGRRDEPRHGYEWFRSQTIRRPARVRNSSTFEIVRECGAMSPARPRVATPGASSAESSSRMRSTIESTWPAKP